MRHFMICFAGFVKSVRSNRVVREERLLGSFSLYVACVHVMLLVYSCLNHGAPERQSLQLRCTLRRDPAYTSEETERLQGVRRDPLSVKIREVGRGLSLADTQTGR